MLSRRLWESSTSQTELIKPRDVTYDDIVLWASIFPEW